MNALISTKSNAVTMSSLEMVEYINSQRGEGEAVLAHSDFLKKVPQVLGEIGAGNFSFTYRDVQNKERPCYRLPKREACLMAMSYSYDLQAKVFDHMTLLEEKLNGDTRLPVAFAGDMQAINDHINTLLAVAIERALSATLPALVHGELAKRQTVLRHGMTAGQVWTHYGLPKIKGAAAWISHQLARNDCVISGAGRGELGGRTAKLFDPDKVRARMESGLLAHCAQYVKNREGHQGNLFKLVGK